MRVRRTLHGTRRGIDPGDVGEKRANAQAEGDECLQEMADASGKGVPKLASDDELQASAASG